MHAEISAPQIFEKSGVKDQPKQKLTVPQPTNPILGAVLDSGQMRARISPECSLRIQRLAVSFGVVDSLPLKRFQKLLGLMLAASSVVHWGLSLQHLSKVSYLECGLRAVSFSG